MTYSRHNILALSITIILAFGMWACSDSSDSGASDAAVIQGSIENSGSDQQSASLQNVEGTTVAAARITSGGSFETIQGTETEADAQGNFTLDVDVSAATYIAIIAEVEGETRSGFLSTKVENGQSYTLKPLSAESTAETEIRSRLVATGNAENVSKADIEMVVNGAIASEIKGSSTIRNSFASGLSSAADARAAFVSEFSSESQSEVLSTAAELRAQAQFELESALASAGSDSQVEAAFEAFVQSNKEAWIMAGLDEATAAKMIHMETEVFMNATSSVSSEIRNEVRARTAYYAAIAIDAATQAEVAASGMSDATVSAVASAGAELRSSVKASAGAAAEVSAAFETYHEEVRQAMENDGSAEASVIVSIDSQINATGGPKSIFNSSLSGTVSASLLVEIYSTFKSSIQSIVESELDGGSLNAEAVTRVMLLINLAS